jgi:glycosyltransferase involved in cell wall biosynthesis
MRNAPAQSVRVIQFVLGDAAQDARVLRASWALRDAGHRVTIVGKSKEAFGTSTLGRLDPIDGMEHFAMPWSLAERYGVIIDKLNRMNPLYSEERGVMGSMLHALSRGAAPIERAKTVALIGPYALAFASHRTGALRQLSRVLRLRQRPSAIARSLAALAPDVIHAHDLLGFSFIAEEIRKKRIPIIYDAHELERGRNAPSWSEEKRRAHADLEGKLIGLAAGVITVSPAIAAILEDAYRIPRPTVLVNSPPRSIIRENRPLRQRLRLPPDHRVVLYVGGISSGRGLERLLHALKWLPKHVHVALMGPVLVHYESAFARLLSAVGEAKDRIHVLGRMPYQDLIHEAWGADLGYNGIELSCESYRNALPNKFFEYVFADVPVLSTPQTDPVALTREYRLGRIIPDADAEQIAKEIRSALEERLTIPKESRAAFVDRFCWESQRQALLDLYGRLPRQSV